jgi:hypothetical protein
MPNAVLNPEFLAKPLSSKNAYRCRNSNHDGRGKPGIKPTNANLFQHPPTGLSTFGVRFRVRASDAVWPTA